MMCVRLSGHSGAGKSRLIAALPSREVKCQRAVLYTSRLARDGEIHGKDYYFLSRSAIVGLPLWDFYIGPVREMVQAVDLVQLESDLRSNSVVMIEIFADLWPGLVKRLEERMQCAIPSASVFMTAVDPQAILDQAEDRRASFIETEVERILTWRGKDEPDKIKSRAKSAVKEILSAIGPDGRSLYAMVFHSAPEGPDGQDDWTRDHEPVGRAKQVIDEFVAFFKSISGKAD
jgi:hypothetical protein